MTFKLQPGDYIPTAEVPGDKRQAVIDAFSIAYECDVEADDFHKWENIGVDGGEISMWNNLCQTVNASRRVTLEQILGEQSPSWDGVGPELLDAAINLRIAQKTYMKNRGNEKYGQDVAYYAGILDEAITKARSIK